MSVKTVSALRHLTKRTEASAKDWNDSMATHTGNHERTKWGANETALRSYIFPHTNL